MTKRDTPNTAAHGQRRGHMHTHGTGHQRVMLGRIVVSALLLVGLLLVDVESLPLGQIGQGLLYYVAVYLVIGYDIVGESVRGMARGRVFDENLLMTVATLGAFGLALAEQSGDYTEAVAVMLFFQTGELIERCAVARSRRGIEAMRGAACSASSATNGEEAPCSASSARNGDEVAEGRVATPGRSSGDFIARFARVYTPVVCFGALAVAVVWPTVQLCTGGEAMWGVWMYRALTFLVISCPCALVISVPLTFSAGIAGASREGVLVRDANVLEALARMRGEEADVTTGRSEEAATRVGPQGVTTGRGEEAVTRVGPQAVTTGRGDLRMAIGGVDGDAAIGAADIVLRDGDQQRMARAIGIARRTLDIVWQNIVLAIGVKVVCLALGALGIANMWLAVFADEGVMLVAILNAMRASRRQG